MTRNPFSSVIDFRRVTTWSGWTTALPGWRYRTEGLARSKKVRILPVGLGERLPGPLFLVDGGFGTNIGLRDAGSFVMFEIGLRPSSEKVHLEVGISVESVLFALKRIT